MDKKNNNGTLKNSQNKKIILILLGLFIGFILFIVLLFFIASALINIIPKSLENKLGSLVKTTYVGENIELTKTQSIKNNLRIFDKNGEYNIFVIKSKDINALALPGNIIVVYEGLFDKSNTDELNFVLAHELSHFSNRDHLKSFGRMIFIGLITNTLGQDYSSYIGSKIIELVNLSFSRNAEYKADSDAIKLLKGKELSTKGAVTFMRKIQNSKNESGFTYFSTHPNTEDRIKKIEELN